jgi:hypothetical protein
MTNQNKKFNKNRWPESSHGRLLGKPKKGQKMCNSKEPKKGEG